MKKVKHSKEELNHFNCSECERWWTISDWSKDKKTIFCPWCGIQQKIEIIKK